MLMVATGIAVRYNMRTTKAVYNVLLFSTAFWLGGTLARYTSQK